MEDIMDFQLPQKKRSIIKVVGVGGGGSNAVNYMFKQGITGVDFVVCNTDNQALDSSPIETKIHLGKTLTEGMGAGSKPEVGREAAIENLMDIEGMLDDNARMVFITAGMGGGTGTGAAPIIAKVAKDKGLLTVGIVTIPFLFEGKSRIQKALEGVEQMQSHVDALLVINNERLKDMYGNSTVSEAFSRADSVLSTAAKGIAEIITIPGYVNVDFKDVQSVMKDSGVAIMGSGAANGEGRAMAAIDEALTSPLLHNNDVGGAHQILLQITSGTEEVKMDEITEITDYLHEKVGSNASIIWGTGTNDQLGDKIGVTIIATGFRIGHVHESFNRPEPPKEEKVKVLTLDDEFDDKDVSHTASQQSFDFTKVEERPMQVEFDMEQHKPQNPFDKYYNKPPQTEQPKNTASGLEEVRDSKAVGIVHELSDQDLRNDKYIEYLERVPAYARKKGQTQSSQDDVQVSSFSMTNQNGEWTIKDNNRFLNDNVD